MNFSAYTEKRLASRTAMAAPVQFLVPQSDSFHAKVTDISELGMGVGEGAALPVGLECFVAVALAGERRGRRLNALVKVVYSFKAEVGYRTGVCFLDMDATSRDCVRCLANASPFCAGSCCG